MFKKEEEETNKKQVYTYKNLWEEKKKVYDDMSRENRQGLGGTSVSLFHWLQCEFFFLFNKQILFAQYKYLIPYQSVEWNITISYSTNIY